jgi:hypothetical protein
MFILKVHIIKPSLIKVNSIIEAVKANKFHYSWLLVWYSKAFNHESKVIIKWAISSFLESDIHLLIEKVSVDNLDQTIEKFYEFIFGSFMLTLQKFFLYQKADDTSLIESCPNIAILLSKFFGSFVKSLPTQILKTEFLEKFTGSICNYTWNATCLLFLSKVFYDLDGSLTDNLSSNIIKNFHKIIKNSISTQEVFLRSATQTFMTKALIKHLKPKDLTANSFKDFIDFIGMLSSRECLAYKNSTWTLIVEWLQEALNSNFELISPYLFQEFTNFIEETSSNDFTILNESSKLAKFIILFCDTNKESTYKKTIEALTDRLLCCNKYVYSSSEKVEKCLLIFNSMIGYLRSKICAKFFSLTKKC